METTIEFNNDNLIKKPFAILEYNGHNVSEDFTPYVSEISYTDYEKEQSDELSVKLCDYNKLFQNDWHPTKGDKLTAIIGHKGQEQINCGTFTIDEIEVEMNADGDFMDIKALATTTNSPLRTANSKTFENKTLVQIAQFFGKTHGFKVVGEQGFVNVGRQNQVCETDLAFLKRISNNYGYIFKLTDGLLTFTSVESLKSSKALFTLNKEEINNISFSNSATKVYKACSVKYFNPKTKKLCTYTAKRSNGTDTLKLNQKVSSKAEAIKIANANLQLGSKEIKGSISLKEANPLFCAGVNFQINGIGKVYSGLYHITSATHRVSSSGWQVSGEIERIFVGRM